LKKQNKKNAYQDSINWGKILSHVGKQNVFHRKVDSRKLYELITEAPTGPRYLMHCCRSFDLGQSLRSSSFPSPISNLQAKEGTFSNSLNLLRSAPFPFPFPWLNNKPQLTINEQVTYFLPLNMFLVSRELIFLVHSVLFDLQLEEFMHKAKAFSSKINNRVGPRGYNFHTQLQRFWLQLTDKKKMVILAYQ
jgi:hypothetical protein